MALMTHQVQVRESCIAFPTRPLSWNKGFRLKNFKSTLNVARTTNGFLLLECTHRLNAGAPVVPRHKWKYFKISAFRGIDQKEGAGGQTSGSESLKDSIKLSYVPQECEESLTESSTVQNIPVTCSFEAEDAGISPLSIHGIFKSWLALLRIETPNRIMSEAPKRPPLLIEAKEIENGKHETGKGEILKAAWCFFLGLDASVKIPLLIFVPWYLAVNVRYGPQVSKELIPLWIFGPLIAAVYIKVFRAICSLYVFCFRQTVKIVGNLPNYSLLAYKYVAHGELKNALQAKFWQPFVDIKNMDYKEFSRQKLKELEGWLVEKYLDFVESIWPYYCRTIRLLKRAQLL